MLIHGGTVEAVPQRYFTSLLFYLLKVVLIHYFASFAGKNRLKTSDIKKDSIATVFHLCLIKSKCVGLQGSYTIGTKSDWTVQGTGWLSCANGL